MPSYEKRLVIGCRFWRLFVVGKKRKSPPIVSYRKMRKLNPHKFSFIGNNYREAKIRRRKMNLTQKETTLLNDLKSQEQLCIEKYNKYSQMAHDPELKNLFSTLSQNEQKHFDTLNQILQGQEVSMPQASPSAVQAGSPSRRSRRRCARRRR